MICDCNSRLCDESRKYVKWERYSICQIEKRENSYIHIHS